MKVTDILFSDDETASVIDIVSELEVSQSTKDKINEAVGGYLVEQTLLAVGGAKSPVSGASWPGLSKEYKKFKEEYGATVKANMELTGDMLSAFGYKVEGDEIKIGVFGAEAAKADGHNNFSGESQIPTRQFLPAVGDEYKGPIARGVIEIINDIVAEDTKIEPFELSGIETKSELYDTLAILLGIAGRASISRAVLANASIRNTLYQLDLLDLL